jgi:poly(hydroxyalkanoate) depolymerase family esterase
MAKGDTVAERRLPAGDAPGSRDRDYLVYASAKRRLRRRPGLVMILHGCKQTGHDMARATRCADWAGRRNYVALFPSVTSWAPFPMRAENCWGFWMPHERTRGAGEVGDLGRLLEAVADEFGCARSRRYVTGLSSGGAMAAALADAYPELVRAAGVVAGLSYAENPQAIALSPASPIRLSDLADLKADMQVSPAAGARGPVPLQVIHSTHDGTVRIDNARMLRDVWLERLRPDGRLRARPRRLRDWSGSRTRYRRLLGPPVLETAIYDGRSHAPTHYWPGDRQWGDYAHPDGPSATALSLAFFRKHGL